MKFLLVYTIIFMMNSTAPTELDIIKEIFFNAPIENADSTVIDFFKNSDNFRYEEKKGTWNLVYGGNTYTQWLHSFYFQQHPLVGNSFDTGRVLFYTSDHPVEGEVFSITLELQYKNQNDSKKAYIILSDKVNKITAACTLNRDSTIHCHINEFEDFKKIFVSFRKETYRSKIAYEIELRGTDYNF